jgi:S1-C subfamily serine protease
MINGETVGPDEFAFIKTPLGKLEISCLSVQSNQVRIQVHGEKEPRTLTVGSFVNPCAEGFKLALELRTLLETNVSRGELAEAQRRSTLYLQGKEEPDASSGAWAALKDARAQATAFFITDDGYALTAFHAVAERQRVSLRTSGGTYPATIIKTDQRNDLAVLKTTGRFRALPLQSSREVRLGASVFTIGFPNAVVQGLEPKLTRGEISSLAGIADDPRAFQISVPVQPGNSGGALVNLRGNVVGVVVERLNDFRALSASGSLPQNVNYAIKSSYALGLLESIPEVSNRLKKPLSEERRLEDVAKEAQEASAIVVTY